MGMHQETRPEANTNRNHRRNPFSPSAQKNPNTFRNLALGFTGATFAAAFAFYASKKYVEGKRKADLEIYEGEIQPTSNVKPSS
ncbi:hypothetical protein BDP27DRAFT_1417000 [Rhodocollybia butyracea]|uniref:Uncharacterized protein n=1 Tax=Rhodocollybia butyracea TaxID=206335 RepID=A0A9P5Q3Q8_9AGAR|nr:hypothetical protein BDP27DRAFT_1417000 [Rhodocollybia butyracea]